MIIMKIENNLYNLTKKEIEFEKVILEEINEIKQYLKEEN